MAYRSPAEIIADADARGLRRVLIVTALQLEMAAVRAHVTSTGAAMDDAIIYECGTFAASNGDWLAVVAQCGAGNHSAHSVVATATKEFGGFELILFAGIAGSRKADVPIGSVVAANHVYNPYSGKYEDGAFTSRPRGIDTDDRLVQLAEKVSRDGEWHKRIQGSLGGPALPDPKDCPPPYPPGSFVAPIASVEAVVADPKSELAQLIAKHGSDAHAIEMEGYGAARAAQVARTPALVVRGISDRLKGKTAKADKLHQPVAAMFAAAFAFQVLEEWSQTQMQPPAAKPRRTRNPKASGSKDGPAAPKPVKQITEPPVRTPSASRTAFVLNFEGETADFPEARIDGIVATLERVTGAKVRVLRGEAGSFRLFVEFTGEAVQPPVDALRKALADEHGVELLGGVPEGEYKLITSLAGELEPASQAMLAWPADLPDGRHIERPELEQLASVLNEQEFSTTVVLGLPGSGKSALLATLGRKAAAEGWPVLAIKGDLLPTDVDSEEKLQAHLGLSTTPSRLLERIATFRPVLLILDQLDALAKYLDLHTGRLTVLLNLVRRLGRTRNVHIVLSARTFEAQHDARLLAIAADSVNLELPSWAETQKVLDAHGVKTEGWPEDAKEVLRAPQALATFLRLKDQGGEPFRTYQTMLDRLWTERVLSHPRGAALAKLATDIAHDMAENENLWLAEARYDDRLEDLNTLVAAEILTRSATAASIGFSHQTLFDHALARSFAREAGRLSEYVLARQSSLFVRPKLWAALTYLRGVEIGAYEKELEAIWKAPGLRMHLRLLLVDFLGQQSEPNTREELLMAWGLQQPKLEAPAFRAISGSPGWFERFADSFIATAMRGDDECAGLAANVLGAAWPFAHEKVLALLRDHWEPTPERDRLAWNVLSQCDAWSDEAASLAVSIVQRTDVSVWAVDYIVGAIGVDKPEAALRLARAQLDRELVAARKLSAEREKLKPPKAPDARFAWEISHSPEAPLTDIVEQSRDWETVAVLAEAAPAQAIDALWPWFVEIAQSLRRLEGSRTGLLGYGLNHRLDFRFEGEHSLNLPEPSLLAALRLAGEGLAQADQSAFEAWVTANEQLDIEAAHRLFAHAMATHPEEYATFALSYLMGDDRRLWLGSLEDQFSTAKRLVGAVAPFWSDEQLQTFIAWLSRYAPKRPPHMSSASSRRSFPRLVRRLKLGFLRRLPRDRLTADVRRQIEEESRAVGDDRVGATFTGVRSIGSPMTRDAIAKAASDDVLNAFEELPDETGWDHPHRAMTGGNIQLSREFAEFAKANPDQAAPLMRRFRPKVGERAAGYALDAMAEGAEPNLVVSLFLDLAAQGFSGEEYRVSAARAIGRLVGRKATVGDDVLAILEGWLEPSAPPKLEGGEAGEEHQEDSLSAVLEESPAQEERLSSVLWGYAGMTTLPHGNYPALEAITRALMARGEHDRLGDILARHLEREEDPDVWKAMLHYFVYFQPTVKSRRAEILREVFDRHPDLQRTTEAAFLLAHSHWWGSNFVKSMLAIWPEETAQSKLVYGELVGLIALTQPKLAWARNLLEGVVAEPARNIERAGAANAAVNLWSGADHREHATDLLLRLIPAADTGVWEAVFDLFRLVDELAPEPQTVRLLGMIAEHVRSAGRIGSSYVVARLLSILPHEATVVARIAEGLIDCWRDELGDIRTSTAMVSSELIDLAVTLHRLGPETREAGTQMLESLLLMEAYAAKQTLDEIDARFRPTRAPVRRRLSRRSAKRGRLRRAPTS